MSGIWWAMGDNVPSRLKKICSVLTFIKSETSDTQETTFSFCIISIIDPDSRSCFEKWLRSRPQTPQIRNSPSSYRGSTVLQRGLEGLFSVSLSMELVLLYSTYGGGGSLVGIVLVVTLFDCPTRRTSTTALYLGLFKDVLTNRMQLRTLSLVCLGLVPYEMLTGFEQF